MAFEVGFPIENASAECALCLAVVHFHVLGETVEEVEGFATYMAGMLRRRLLPLPLLLLPG
jgi:hypothetical protein